MRRFLAILLCFSLLTIPVKGTEQPRYVALTFDDGPSGRFTRRLLQGLEQRQVQATFLLCGYRLKDYQELAQQIFDAGHEIGLHGYSHDNMAKMNRRQLKNELSATRALLPEGCDAVFLRPPGGSATDLVEQVAREEGLSLLLWSVDPRDWATHDAAAVETAVVRQVQDGDVVLLHDLSDSSVNAALSIVDRLHGEGFQFVTVSQLAALRNTSLQPGKTYCKFP
ncbi:MAG: peptidoglycan N-acetylglucosamine deacetylase [Ruminococcaceae bacterium]|nr:peptidoglycan N-acetylglucosamine deacetylase [Oscillospiraceae bacterium]